MKSSENKKPLHQAFFHNQLYNQKEERLFEKIHLVIVVRMLLLLVWVVVRMLLLLVRIVVRIEGRVSGRIIVLFHVDRRRIHGVGRVFVCLSAKVDGL